jgi:hypothetical protein
MAARTQGERATSREGEWAARILKEEFLFNFSEFRAGLLLHQ